MVDRHQDPVGDRLLDALGVARPPASTVPFDPGYDPVTLESHLAQSGHLMAALKLSMACWMIADGGATRDKIASATRWGVPVVTGGGPFEIAAAGGVLEDYLDLCSGLGVARVEAGEGFTTLSVPPERVAAATASRGLELQFELGGKHSGSFDRREVEALIGQGQRWLDAGAVQLVVEARESAADVGLFSADGAFSGDLADQLVGAFGLETLLFEAPSKPSQFAILDRYGPGVRLTNVRLEELLRVEIYRRGIHSDAFSRPALRPGLPRARPSDGSG